MIEIGKNQKLKAVRRTPQGMYLGDDHHEVLLPNKYIPEQLKPGDEIEVFVYLDSEERIVATTLTPKVKLNEFAVLKVKDVNKTGAFLDWGLEKDLMVPFSEQQKNMRQGQEYLVYMYLDTDSNRLTASSKIDKFISNKDITIQPGEKVELLIGDATEIGFNVIINNTYKGLVYRNEIFKKISSGDRITGYIKHIREDNKIDVSLQPTGYKKNIDSSANELLMHLKAKGGFLPLNDHSSPEEISGYLGMSKKTFKKAVGSLYKQRLIIIEGGGIRLV